jgi:hypothetical protein
MLRSLALLLPLTLLLGCPLTGDNYPQQYASAYCSSLFTCVESTSDIDLFLQYDDEDECLEKKQAEIEGSSWYDQYLEGDRTFDKDNGDACVKELDELRDDPDCGTMGLLDFGFDASTEECSDVFPAAE